MKKQPVTAVAEAGIDFTNQTVSDPELTTLNMRRGKTVSLLRPLVTIRPPQGWSVIISVLGHSMKVMGNTAAEVYSRVDQVYRENGISLLPVNLWFNLNLIWIPRVNIRYMTIPYETLLQLGGEGCVTPKPKTADLLTRQQLAQVRVRDPIDIIGPKLWGMLQTYLAKTDYEETTFSDLVNEVNKAICDDEIGCPACCDHFAEILDVDHDWSTQQAAREWVWKTMNSIREEQGKYQLTFDEAKTVNLWT